MDGACPLFGSGASMTTYRTAPLPSAEMPPGIPFIVGNEAAERFSFYGMRALLVVFMTQYLLGADGRLAVMDEAQARAWFHLFVAAVYFTPVLGALISDGLLGKYRTIIALSIVYCLGHLALAMDHTRAGLAIGLGLIALGSGGIKPCVSAHLGDQFGPSSRHRLPRAFGWFYFSINLGAFTSIIATPWLLEHAGPAWAFGVPGLLMLAATLVFWAGRHRFVHIPPGGAAFLRESLGRTGLTALKRLALVFLLITTFWALFDQTGSAWVLQAEHMDRRILGFDVLPAQIQAANPLLVMLLIPLFNYRVYPAIDRVWRLTELRKMSIGLFVTVLAFATSTWIQLRIDGGARPQIAWQLLAYVLLTSAEVLVSITGLEFAYTQAPRTMKSFVMSFFMLSIAAGNLFTSAVNFFIRNPDGTSMLEGAQYYAFFTLLMLATALAFALAARFYQGETYLNEEQAATVGEHVR